MVNYFLYVRKSTDTEDKQVLSIQSQLNEVREFAQKEGIEIVREFQESIRILAETDTQGDMRD